MTWEQAVESLRNNPDSIQLVNDAYLSSDLINNIEKYGASLELLEIKKILDAKGIPTSSKIRILDIGAGNGISSLNFAMLGFSVVALEPDGSKSVGNRAIQYLIDYYNLPNIEVVDAFGENLPFDDFSFDIVFARQVLHHAYNLPKFVSETYRVLKPTGILISVRDHVVSSESEKQRFLNRHPLHKFYGGENAFTLKQYKGALSEAGFKRITEIGPSQSPINYEPWSKERLKQKIRVFGKSTFLLDWAWKLMLYRLDRLPGRLYSFISEKE